MNRLILISVIQVQIWSNSFKTSGVMALGRLSDQERYMHAPVSAQCFVLIYLLILHL